MKKHSAKSHAAVLAAGMLGAAMIVSAPGALAESGGATMHTRAAYTASNSALGNTVLAYDRAADGTLTAVGEISTGGLGTGGGLGNQGGLIISDDGKTMLVVNAGSNDISLLKLHKGVWMLSEKVSSGGIRPISITLHDNLIYVLNAGNDTISGFTLDSGDLEPIPGSTRSLSGAGTGPAQISFNPNGTVLLVTEKATNKIDTYTVDQNGVATGPIVQSSNGMTPFGFAFDKRGNAVVSEAFGGTASALSSYEVENDGSTESISTSVDATGQRAACWVVITKNGKFAYTTNTASGTVSSYTIGHDGSLTLLNAVAATTGGRPTDADISRNGQFLYVLVAGTRAIQGYRIDQGDGSLALVETATGLPASANGLAVQ